MQALVATILFLIIILNLSPLLLGIIFGGIVVGLLVKYTYVGA